MSERDMDKVTFFYVEDIFSRNFRGDFSLKFGIHSVKVYTKKVSNIEEYNFIQVPLTLLTTRQVIEVLYL